MRNRIHGKMTEHLSSRAGFKQSGILSRRLALEKASMGFGAAALATMLSGEGRTEDGKLPRDAALPKTHTPAKAKHVIFCFMSGGVSSIDSFDPKPRLTRDHGKQMPVKIERTMFNNNG